MVDFEIFVVGIVIKEILKKNYFVIFFKLEMYLDCNRDLMFSL